MFFIAIWISVGKNVEKAPGPIDHDPINNETIQQPEEDDQLPAGDKREEEAAEEEGKKIEIMLKNTSAYDSYWNFKGAEAVSYTHLDVYKRQGLNPAHVLEIYHRAQQMVEHPRTDEVEKVEKPKATGRKGKNRTLSIGLYTCLLYTSFLP